MRGRPKKENTRKRSLRVRLTDEEFRLLTEKSKETGRTKSDILREFIKGES